MKGRRGPGWWAANACLWVSSILFLLPFIWLVLTALKPVEQTMSFQWLPRGYYAAMDKELVPVVKERQVGTPLLRVKDILDWDRFCSLIAEAARGGNRPAVQRVWSLLSERGRRAVLLMAEEARKSRVGDTNIANGRQGRGHGREDLRFTIIDALNRVLERRDLYTQQAFPKADLLAEARALLDKGVNSLATWELQRLNRLLLARACPGLVAGIEDSIIAVIEEGKLAGERLILPASAWKGQKVSIVERDADLDVARRRKARLEKKVPAGWWLVREKFLRKYADRQPRWTCLPEEQVQETIRFWWENFYLAVEYLSDRDRVTLRSVSSEAPPVLKIWPDAGRTRSFALTWQREGALKITRYEILTFRSHAKRRARVALVAKTRGGQIITYKVRSRVSAGIEDHEVSLSRLHTHPQLKRSGWITGMWLVADDSAGQETRISEVKLLHYRATFWTFLGNTLFVALLGVAGTLLSSSLVAYGFSRLEWPGRDKLFWLVLSTMMVPFPVLMVPLFAVFRELGWVGTLRPLWVPAFFGSAFNIFLLRQFFMTIPRELSDAARIDGCSEFGIYWRIILPLSKPALAVVALFHFLWAWNDFLGPLIYLTKPKTFTLSLALQFYQSQHGGSEWHLLMAMSVLIIIPIIVLFFFTQKTFIQGIATSGMKG